MNNMEQKLESKVSRTWMTGGSRGYPATTTIALIPRSIAKFYKLDSPSNIVCTPTEKGILITKLELPQ